MKNAIRRVLILAGSGGHAGYAYSIAEALNARGAKISFLAPRDEPLMRERLAQFGNVEPLTKPRGPKTPAAPFLAGFVRSFLVSVSKVSIHLNAAVSTGSNFCIPPGIIAWAKGIPLVNIEDFGRLVKPSRTAALLRPFSALTVLQWEEQKEFLRGVVIGPLIPKTKIKPSNGGYILVTGGTYGHRLLFNAIERSNLHNIVLQTGQIDPSKYQKTHSDWKVFGFTGKFENLLASAEVIVTHFGSATLLEAVAYQKPIVLVPNPDWTRTTGFQDAKCLAKKINAVLVHEINPAKLIDAIHEARSRRPPELPNGTEKLADLIINLDIST